MSAWFLALFSLFSTDIPSVRPVVPKAELAVYLTVSPNQPAAPLDAMKRELSSLMDAAGYRILWRDPDSPEKGGESADVAMLELRGSCGLPSGSYRVERAVSSGASLAQTSVNEQGVLPFSWVNCAELTRMLGPALYGEAPAQRDYLYGRAVARAVAHEFYHVMMRSRGHGHEGLARPRFTVGDLLDERFNFDSDSVNQLRQRAVDADAVGSEPATGR